MSKADDIFWREFGAILGLLTLFGILMFIIARSIAWDAFERQSNAPSAVAKRIVPMAAVRVGDPAATVAPAPQPEAAMPAATAAAGGAGESVYTQSCSACHATGAAGAPKLDDQAAWAPRIEQGADALIASVLNGKGAMPAKGGNAALTEEEIRAAVEYMLSQVPGGMAAPAAAAEAPAVQPAAAQPEAAPASAVATASAAPASAAPEAAAGKPGDEVYNTGCVACHATGAANAPRLDDKAAWETRAANGMDALITSVLKGKGAMPPKGGLATLGEADIANAVRYMLQQAGVDAGG